MQLKRYQQNAVEQMVDVSKALLGKEGSRICVLEAPTGSGKTIMVAAFLQRLGEEQLGDRYAFVWISSNDLHAQSKEKLESYLEPSRYSFSFLEDIQDLRFHENEIAFVNWESLNKRSRNGEWKSTFMKDGETERNLKTFSKNAREDGLKIILIVDESHHAYWSERSQEIVREYIDPKLTIEVSATPEISPKPADIATHDAGYVPIKFSQVVEEGMVKKNVIINPKIKDFLNLEDVADEVVLQAAMAKLDELKAEFKKQKSDVHPLLLIQLPSEAQDLSALDERKIEFVERYLKDNFGVSVANQKLAVWLSERKDNVDPIDGVKLESIDSRVDVLLFKQAIALGWDCPRAQILVMFREIADTTFKIQTVGRIMRMPEIRHYEDEILDQAYVFTNLASIKIDKDEESQKYFRSNKSIRKDYYSPLNLPSVYIQRADYGDLTAVFRKHFFKEANAKFGITVNDFAPAARKKADILLDLEQDELKVPVLSDVVFSDIDHHDRESIAGQESVYLKASEDDVKLRFTQFAKLCSLPYAPVRSHTKIQQAIYDWFDGTVGYKGVSRLEIQRILVCSESNQRIFREIIDSAKARFKEERNKITRERQETNKKASVWNVPETDYFDERHEERPYSKSVLEPAFFSKNQWEPEQKFQDYIDRHTSVKWWYKNGESREIYLGIPYLNPIDNLWHTFYPDYVVVFEDGRLGIFDTKSGFTAKTEDISAKYEALCDYLVALKKKKIKAIGGIVHYDKTGLRYFDGDKYPKNVNSSDWDPINF